MEQRQPADVLEFAAGLGIELYPWQADVNLTIAEAVTKKRINIAVRAPNEAGKVYQGCSGKRAMALATFPPRQGSCYLER